MLTLNLVVSLKLKLIFFFYYNYLFSFLSLGLLDDPSVLIEGVLFRARYLGSTQLVCEGQPTKSTRMMQAEEAVSRIKVNSFILFHFFIEYCESNL